MSGMVTAAACRPLLIRQARTQIGLNLSCASATPRDAHFQDTPHKACLAALTRLKTLSLAQPVDRETGRPMGTGKYGDKLTVLSSLCSLQVEAVVHIF